MEFDFTSSTLRKLTSEDQMAKYKQLASQAEKSGEIAIANQWRRIAAELLELMG